MGDNCLIEDSRKIWQVSILQKRVCSLASDSKYLHVEYCIPLYSSSQNKIYLKRVVYVRYYAGLHLKLWISAPKSIWKEGGSLSVELHNTMCNSCLFGSWPLSRFHLEIFIWDGSGYGTFTSSPQHPKLNSLRTLFTLNHLFLHHSFHELFKLYCICTSSAYTYYTYYTKINA